MATNTHELESWLNKTKLNKAGLLETLVENGVTSLKDFHALSNQDEVTEFVESLNLKIILRKQLKEQLLILIESNNFVCAIHIVIHIV